MQLSQNRSLIKETKEHELEKTKVQGIHNPESSKNILEFLIGAQPHIALSQYIDFITISFMYNEAPFFADSVKFLLPARLLLCS